MKPLDRMTTEELVEELAWRRSEMGEGVLAYEVEAVRAAFGLTAQQAHAALILYRAKDRGVTRAALLDQLPNYHRSDDTLGKSVGVVVHFIRARMGKAAVKTLGHGHGRYAMPQDARARIAAALCTIPDELRRVAA